MIIDSFIDSYDTVPQNTTVRYLKKGGSINTHQLKNPEFSFCWTTPMTGHRPGMTSIDIDSAGLICRIHNKKTFENLNGWTMMMMMTNASRCYSNDGNRPKR